MTYKSICKRVAINIKKGNLSAPPLRNIKVKGKNLKNEKYLENYQILSPNFALTIIMPVYNLNSRETALLILHETLSVSSR
jgi:hypothetical protein